MDTKQVIEALDAEIVGGQLLARDEDGAMQIIGQNVNGVALLNDIGEQLMASAATPSPRRRAARAAKAAPTPEPTPAPDNNDPAAQPTDVSLNVSSDVTATESLGG